MLISFFAGRTRAPPRLDILLAKTKASTIAMDVINLALLLLLALGIVGNNATVSIAVALLLLMRLLSLERFFPVLEQHGLQIGIIILTIGILTPLASGKITPASMLDLFTHWQTVLAVVIGVFVAYLAGKGTALMAGNPLIVTGLLFGTIIGVTFFRGVAVGPLIAAGILAFILQFLPK
ncbi:hypothetical protein D478_24073 [Brevibacillus agri BAB-2500]|nr:hypothetical protein D478_24073 [Brevibacillus agri BAB-2500]